MPEPQTPTEAASAAYDALRALAHTVRQTPPGDLYGLTGELLGITRLLPDVLRKTSSLALARSDEATVPGERSPQAGVWVTEEAARAFIRAADHLDHAETDIDRASQHLSTIAWQSTERAPRPGRAEPGVLADAETPVRQAAHGTMPVAPVSSPVSSPGSLPGSLPGSRMGVGR